MLAVLSGIRGGGRKADNRAAASPLNRIPFKLQESEGLRVKELATWLEAPWEGEGDREIRRVATLEDAGDEDLSFVAHGRAAKLASASRAACLLVANDFVNETRRTVIRTPDPRAAVARAIPKLHPRLEPSPGVHPTAVLGPGAVIGKGASIGPLVSLGAG